jgi:hypothetical protein
MAYEVIVGNVGVVYRGEHDRAVQEFNDYVAMSLADYGRAANEPVWLICREVVLAEFDPRCGDHLHVSPYYTLKEGDE